MSISLLMDVHVRRAITEGLRQSGVDVLTAQEDGSVKLSDPELLDRATIPGRVLFSQDDEIGNTPLPSNSTKQPSDLA